MISHSLKMDKCNLIWLMVVLVESSYGQMMSTAQMYNKIAEIEQTVLDLKKQLANYGSSPMVTQRSNVEIPNLTTKRNSFTLRSRAGTNIAFYAILVDDTTLSYRMSLIFDSSRTNNGNAYDPRTGIFKCPVTGTYSFSLNIACSSGNYLEASIMKGNNVPLFNSICKNLDATGIHQNGGSAVVKLIKGDLISVKMIWPGDTLATVKGRGLSSFSGFLLNSST